VPTFEMTRRFERDRDDLSPTQRAAFRTAVQKLVEDMSRGSFRKGLRVRGIEGASGIYEMTWASDGRATFQYGPPVREEEPHVIWRRIGGPSVFTDP